MRAIPLVLISLTFYWVLALFGGDAGIPRLTKEVFTLPLPAGRSIAVTGSDLSIAVTALLLVLALLRARSARAGLDLIGQLVAVVTAVAALVMFLAEPLAASPAIVVIVVAALIEAIGSRVIGVRNARRDIGLSMDDGSGVRIPGGGLQSPRPAQGATAYYRVPIGMDDMPDTGEPARLPPGSATAPMHGQAGPALPLPPTSPGPPPARPRARRWFAGFWRSTSRAGTPMGESEDTTLTRELHSTAALADPLALKWAEHRTGDAGSWPDLQPAAGSTLDTVDCSVFAPSALERGKPALVQVLVHVKADLIRAAKMAQTVDPKAGRRGVASLEVPVRRGAAIELMLDAPDLIVDNHFGVIDWDGRPQRLAFPVTVPSEFARTEIRGTVFASIDGTPVGEVAFSVHILGSPAMALDVPARASGFVMADPLPLAEPEVVPAGTDARRYSIAFVSYARADFEKVAFFAQGLEQSGIQPFVDITSIEPGDDWAAKIEQGIAFADVFYLMWSKNAAKSPWVDREIRAAIDRSRRTGDRQPRILPIALHRGAPKPPDDIAKFHFDSRWLAHREAQRTPLFAVDAA